MMLKNIIIGGCFFLLPLLSFSQQLVYKAINPAFGGETFNYQWLLSSANEQNGFTAPTDDASSSNSSLDSFSESLNRQLLSQISRSLFNDQFTDGELEPGTFTYGTLEVEVIEGLTGLIINILDTGTGEQTEIIVPNN